MVDADLAIDAIVDEVRSRIPTLQEFAATTDVGDMGSDVTIPAVWMSLLLSDHRLLKSRVRIHECEVIIRDRQLANWLAPRERPATDDAVTDYAAAIAQHVANTYGSGVEDRIGAAQTLFQAAISVLLTVLPPEAVLDTVEHLPEIFDIRAKLGIGEVRQ